MLRKIFMFLCLLFSTCIAEERSTRYQGVIFDFSNVVADVNVSGYVHFLTHTFDISTKELKKISKEAKAYVDKGGNESDFWEEFAAGKHKILGSDWHLEMDKIYHASFKEISGVVDIIKGLKGQGYKVALLSNMDIFKAKAMQYLHYDALFDPIVLAQDVGVKKPNLKMYKTLLKKINIPAPQLLFIDDSGKNIQAAKSLGIDSIKFKSAEKLLNELALRRIFL